MSLIEVLMDFTTSNFRLIPTMLYQAHNRSDNVQKSDLHNFNIPKL